MFTVKETFHIIKDTVLKKTRESGSLYMTEKLRKKSANVAIKTSGKENLITFPAVH